MTLDDNYALCCIHTCVSEPTTKIEMKIDPYYQRQNVAQGEGASNGSVVVENDDFRFFRSLYFPILHI